MDHRLIEGLMEAIAPLIKDYLDARMRAAIDPLLEKIALLEGRPVEKGEPGEPGKDADPEAVQVMVDSAVAKIRQPEDGKSVTVDDVRPVLSEMVSSAVAAIELPVPKDGRDGVDGKDAEVDLDALAIKAASLIERPKDGIDGKDAEPIDLGTLAVKAAALIEKPRDGADGKDGRDAEVDLDALALKAAELIRAPKDGVDGIDGKDGEHGRPGKDVDLEFIRTTVNETVTHAVGELPKQPVSFAVDDKGSLQSFFADGQKKDIGRVRGASVMDSHVDDDGMLVLRMSDGREINAGRVRGLDGETPEPRPGPRGRDAVELQILPGLDEARSYAEGVCARWRGGIIRAERDTVPIVGDDIKAAGWSVILEGIFEETEQTVDDGRFIERVTTYTSGREFRRRVQTASILDRDVWSADKDYLKGDGVTWSGSFWVAKTDQPAGKPGDGEATGWRMAVKRGRQGKDGAAMTKTSPPVTVRVPAAATSGER